VTNCVLVLQAVLTSYHAFLSCQLLLPPWPYLTGSTKTTRYINIRDPL
jgi:hypothetical protein